MTTDFDDRTETAAARAKEAGQTFERATARRREAEQMRRRVEFLMRGESFIVARLPRPA